MSTKRRLACRSVDISKSGDCVICRHRISLCALVVLSLSLAGCLTTPSSSPLEPLTDESLAPEPIRSLGLAIHSLCILSGVYALDGGPTNDAPVSDERSRSSRRNGTVRATWLGHSSMLLDVGGVRILTDPVLADGASLASPLPPILVRRQDRTANLPQLDAVVISHGDYDHLHEPSLRAIASRFPKATIFLPERLGHLARAAGFQRVREVAVGSSSQLGRVVFTALPALHATRRNIVGIVDGGAVSWEFRTRSRRVLFVGDTAYGPVFKRIGCQRGPYDLVLVPIGASEPHYFVGDMHISPEDAVRLVQDVRAAVAIGIHWGTFALSPEPREAPARRFRKAAAGRIDARTLRIGDSLVLP
ncbi:MBL fold metallo-hydrolase [Aurantimonas sp. VKM B-3413]|uniref:MBL fold metallo-hydrolase n=1 Tax=Aurantimonas sp. VKM B-3413 TaxID=2779401 RepID=UPI001E3634A0|nr:MBL fold metallo-hydrolase [Aurantimonas sp. VKM B-3413]MCB8840257.1 MBL fold metallo-hydrolase [Aurantimonas sp. VKM B-3413]